MKKILFCFAIFFIGILCVNAETFSIGTKLVDQSIVVTDGVRKYDSVPYIITKSNGEVVYCLNPYELLDTNKEYNTYDYNDSLFNLTDEVISRVNLIAYYGYGYPGHSDSKWYGVTQYLIWKELGIGNVYYTNEIGGYEVSKYTDEIYDIERLVKNYSVNTLFGNDYYEYDLNKSYTLNINNESLNDYDIVSDNLEVYTEGSKLHVITTDKEGVFEIKFNRKSPVTRNYMLYNLAGAQSLIYPGKINNISFSIYIDVSNRSIEIHKKDSEGINREFASLSGAVYELYYNNTRIRKFVTDENGFAIKEQLPIGNYILKEVTPSLGYKLDTNTYKITLNKNNKKQIITSYEKVIKGNLVIEKYYGNDGVYTLEDKVAFEIYDTKGNYIDTITTKDGKASKKLDYGEYIIKQTSGKDGYKKVDNINLTILEEKDYKFVLYNEKEEIDEEPELHIEEDDDIEEPIIEEEPELTVDEIIEKEIQEKEEQEIIESKGNVENLSYEPIKEEVVNVPNTGKDEYSYLVPFLFIMIGLLLIVGKKVTLLK